VQRTITWRNLPPAFVFTCRGARLTAPHDSIEATGFMKK
jgi:hypothetical protein